jgi:hypothetical protein
MQSFNQVIMGSVQVIVLNNLETTDGHQWCALMLIEYGLIHHDLSIAFIVLP